MIRWYPANSEKPPARTAILMRGSSKQSKHKEFVIAGSYEPVTHPLSPWLDCSRKPLSYRGWEPLFWCFFKDLDSHSTGLAK